MRSYYEEPGVEIYHGDALDVLHALRSTGRRFRCVVMDPPYASGTRAEAKKSSSGAMVRGGRFADKPIENDQMTTPGFVWLMRETCLSFRDMIDDGDSVFSFIDWRQWPNLLGAIESTNMRVNTMIVWDKLSFGLGNVFRNQHELIMHASKGVARAESRSFGNVVHETETVALTDALDMLARAARPGCDIRGLPPRVAAAINSLIEALDELPRAGTVLGHKRDDDPDHPSPKPPALIEDFLAATTAPGEWVLDPYMGAGSTLLAAKSTGRSVVGIECKEEHCEAAAKKLRQQPMFAPRPTAASQVVQRELFHSGPS
jgi:site-specific DNA-methyltransferase (adenine-specific)